MLAAKEYQAPSEELMKFSSRLVTIVTHVVRCFLMRSMETITKMYISFPVNGNAQNAETHSKHFGRSKDSF